MATLNQSMRSPDGLLTFYCESGGDGTAILSFGDYPWHTHSDLLVSEYGETEDAAVRSFIEALQADRVVIAIYWQNGEIVDVAVTDSPAEDLKHLAEGKRVDMRYWSGAKFGFA